MKKLDWTPLAGCVSVAEIGDFVAIAQYTGFCQWEVTVVLEAGDRWETEIYGGLEDAQAAAEKLINVIEEALASAP